ncbi:PD-(D/E)XK nuclease family protein [Patescibacteria group bacterium]|nr:PD-(D/E)XK nuclease family protein [Patescibacteria group bacterium]
MSIYYTAKRKTRLFNPESEEPFLISRSGIELFMECPRCFYLDKRLGTARPNGFPFSLNNAVDALLKKEFDIHRAAGSKHPLIKAYGLDAVPYAHEKLEEWRDSRTRGVKYFHEPTNLMIHGGVDDVWVNSKNELHVVDYKATSKEGAVSLDADWQISYKRQVEVYQWLFRKNGFKVSNTAYFVYCNGHADKEAFDGKLEFDITLIPYVGSTDWIESALEEIKETLSSNKIPDPDPDCDYCKYRLALKKVEK